MEKPPHAPASRPRQIAVIGAGVVGLSTAVWLLAANHRVTLYDPFRPGRDPEWRQASSFGNAGIFASGAVLPNAAPGIVRTLPGLLLRRDAPLSISWRDLPGQAQWLRALIRASRPRAYDRIVAELGVLMRQAGPAQDALFLLTGTGHLRSNPGSLYLYRSEAALAAAMPGMELRRREGVSARILGRNEVAAREPHLAPLYAGGILLEDHWVFNTPEAYAAALAAWFLAHGGIHRAAPVTSLRSGDAGAILTCEGQDIVHDHAVIASGISARVLCRPFGMAPFLNAERGYHVLFANPPHRLTGAVCYPEFGFFITPMSEGLRAAGTVELGGAGRPPNPARHAMLERVTRMLVREPGEATRRWVGSRPSTPDSLPFVGPSKHDPRIIHAYDHGHVGLTLAALTGRIVRDLVDTAITPDAIRALSPDRFTAIR
jgi:glycine/D-amino acid oxidase-like deaminating enzyme